MVTVGGFSCMVKLGCEMRVLCRLYL